MPPNRQELSVGYRATRAAAAVIPFLIFSALFLGFHAQDLHLKCCAAKVGLVCKSCGMTRSITSALHGDIDKSRLFHPGGIWFATLLVAFILVRPFPYIFPYPAVIVIDSLLFLLTWVTLAIVMFGLPGQSY